MSGQDLVVEGDRPFERLAQALALGVLAARLRRQLDACPAGQLPQRGREIDPVALHDEGEDVAAAAAAEAVPRFAGGRDDEAGRLLAMERAEALEGRAGFPQLDGLADEVDEVQLLLDLRGCADGRGGGSRWWCER